MTAALRHRSRVLGPRRFRDDRGQATIWMLAFSLAVLMIGVGVSVETWRVVSAWRSLAATADAAAAAGASGIDEAAYRRSGGDVLQLDSTVAERLAYRSLDAQRDRTEIARYQASATTDEITVVVHGKVDLLVLGALRGGAPFHFTATAVAEPHPST